MKNIVEQGLLYDFYGELLTPHQRRIYENAVYNDMSLAEIAEQEGISRQGVHDQLKRCTKALKEYEEKLRMIRRFQAIREETERLREAAEDPAADRTALARAVYERTGRIQEELF